MMLGRVPSVGPLHAVAIDDTASSEAPKYKLLCFIIVMCYCRLHGPDTSLIIMTNILIVITQMAQTRAKEVRNFLKFVQIPKL